jgi:hypothetical protein
VTEDTFGNNLSSGDYNGDGYPDIAYENSDGGVSWLENTGQAFDGGGYVWVPPSYPIVSSSLISYPPTYTNGLTDVLAFANGEGVVCGPYYWPDASNGPTTCSSYIGTYDVSIVSAAVGDLDGDGRQDFLFGGPDLYDAGEGVDVLLSSTARIFEPPPGGQGLPGFQPLQQIAVGNLNGDRYGDLFVFRQDGPWEAWVNTCVAGTSR